MVTVREYALNKGVTERAVYKQMKSKKNAERLDGHIRIIDGKQWLDDIAVSILDESKQTSVVIEKENNEKLIAELNEEISQLNKELRKVYQQLAEQAPQIASAEANKLLLEDKIAAYEEEKRRADQLYRENVELRMNLENEQKKTWLQKLFKK